MTDFNITTAQYTQSHDTDDGIEAVIDGKTVYLPIDTGNRHYVAVKAKHDDPDDSFTIQDAD